MARSLRILFKGAYYHVINRGQGKRNIFLDNKDYSIFLTCLKESCLLYKVTITSYCLMPNHYHLLVHTPNANLSEFMRQLNSVYTQIHNRRHHHDGSLFKGRYKAIVVQEGSYLLRLIRYIHSNPVNAGIVKTMKDFAFSSHNNFMKQEENEWLKFNDILRKQFKSDKQLNVKRAYINFMSINDEELTNYLQNKSRCAVQAIILGDESYMDGIKMRYLNKKRLFEEIPQAKLLHNDIVIKQIKKEIVNEFDIEDTYLYSSIRGKENLARMMAISLARECSRLSYGKIAELFGGIHYKSASKYYERFKTKCNSDAKMSKVFNDLKQRCSQVET
ncbi:MAG: transposase [bacterium]